MTSYALTHSKSFKIGIAGGTVSDWRNYDSIYTERYMGTPQNNPEGYKKSSPVHAAKDLHGKLLLIHGAIDDNVHMQNTIQFVYELQKAGKQFELMIYPKSRHGVTDPLLLKHMRTDDDGLYRWRTCKPGSVRAEIFHKSFDISHLSLKTRPVHLIDVRLAAARNRLLVMRDLNESSDLTNEKCQMIYGKSALSCRTACATFADNCGHQ